MNKSRTYHRSARPARLAVGLVGLSIFTLAAQIQHVSLSLAPAEATTEGARRTAKQIAQQLKPCFVTQGWMKP